MCGKLNSGTLLSYLFIFGFTKFVTAFCDVPEMQLDGVLEVPTRHFTEPVIQCLNELPDETRCNTDTIH
jgi:hypothetical protein